MYDDGPRYFHCPTCGADVGDPCRSPQPRKVLRSHIARQDRYIRDQYVRHPLAPQHKVLW